MCVLLRHSSDWNPHRLHSEPFPPKENHNVGLLRFDDDHDHICYRFAQVQIFGGKSNVFKSLQYNPQWFLSQPITGNIWIHTTIMGPIKILEDYQYFSCKYSSNFLVHRTKCKTSGTIGKIFFFLPTI
jgi:hypothetical protein